MEYNFEENLRNGQALSDVAVNYIRKNGGDPLQEKSLAFAVRIIGLCDYLQSIRCYNSLIDQILRSGTSIGANIHEAQSAVSKAEFGVKMAIAQKEAKESLFWITLLYESKRITLKMYESLAPECEELIKMLSATVKTVRPR